MQFCRESCGYNAGAQGEQGVHEPQETKERKSFGFLVRHLEFTSIAGPHLNRDPQKRQTPTSPFAERRGDSVAGSSLGRLLPTHTGSSYMRSVCLQRALPHWRGEEEFVFALAKNSLMDPP